MIEPRAEGSKHIRHVGEAGVTHLTTGAQIPFAVGDIIAVRGRPKWRVIAVNDTRTVRLEGLPWYARFTEREHTMIIVTLWCAMLLEYMKWCLTGSP